MGDEVADGNGWARRLAGGDTVAAPVALVVAHADDETLWAGAALSRCADLRIIHVTDGAPRDMADARRLGIASRADYAAIRARELDGALDLLGVEADRRAYGIADQEAAPALPGLIDRLEEDLADRTLVLTHPFEGGHPDHDALALAVGLAAERLGRRGRAPAVVEFACYHLAEGQRRFGRFWPDPASPERSRPLSAEERDRVGAAIAAHRSQAAVIDGWRPVAERWRAAPAYDFAAPPPPGAALYDGFGWTMDFVRWQDCARRAVEGERACA